MKTLILLQVLFLFVSCERFSIPEEEKEKTQSYWFEKGQSELDKALSIIKNEKIAKNIIIFIGDGLGVTVTTAGRIYKGQRNGNSGEEEMLAWEEFPNNALLKTYNLDKQVPDSGATATAFFGGVKANYYTLGVNGFVQMDDCQAGNDEDNWVSSILQWAQDNDKGTGIVTSTRITHATPAALYAHSPQRYHECDTTNQTFANCVDIARQLVERQPGIRTNVILGGGRDPMGASITSIDGESMCPRVDQRNLAEEWISDKRDSGVSYAYITNNEEFQNTNFEATDFILGLFSGTHLPYVLDRDNGPSGTPSLEELTLAAISRLKDSDSGYFLMVEGGRIDHAIHNSKMKYALEEVVGLDAAVRAAVEQADEETLIIVMADHSHVVTINGYPERGNNILGKTQYEDISDNMPYPTLMFTNGPGTGNFSYNGTHVNRLNLTNVDTTEDHYVSPSIVPTPMGYETHGGEDIAIYATGPMSHMFHSLHEQSYVAIVMAYAACIGPYDTTECRENRGPSTSQSAAYQSIAESSTVSEPSPAIVPLDEAQEPASSPVSITESTEEPDSSTSLTKPNLLALICLLLGYLYI